ncbi:neurofilament heavy polypeptide-like protein [Labeo rohita]|uniref:Neurofilament heavy polypeptide-like protein n=1 Tax=Labeo rohita TaxID=84645 RepID=A0A498LYH8_LABRO|nr:neurofilament heavy polypeptide-like protein [Labeo rohita]RXN13310.1 neurofilament heavy polypeptide-like protein [Labeo rohita]
MSMSTIPTSFLESAAQVSSPISEEPEYGDLTSVQWWGTIEAGERSCPTSLGFSDESEKAESGECGLRLSRCNTEDSGAVEEHPCPTKPQRGKGSHLCILGPYREHLRPTVPHNREQIPESRSSRATSRGSSGDSRKHR